MKNTTPWTPGSESPGYEVIEDHKVILIYECPDCGMRAEVFPCDIGDIGNPICCEGEEMAYLCVKVRKE